MDLGFYSFITLLKEETEEKLCIHEKKINNIYQVLVSHKKLSFPHQHYHY